MAAAAAAGLVVRRSLLHKNLPVRTASCCSFRTCASLRQEKRSAMDTSYETLKLERVRDKVLHMELNRPEKRNAMNSAFWREMVECFNKLDKSGSTLSDAKSVEFPWF